MLTGLIVALCTALVLSGRHQQLFQGHQTCPADSICSLQLKGEQTHMYYFEKVQERLRKDKACAERE